MALNTDDEILQDFLVEAGEILELLSEQLVDLEARPNDSDLLNAIFRGFHTVKGGAGFLSLTNLVSVCHIAENVFDLLRQGKIGVDADLMDVVLKTLDVVNGMFSEIRSGNEPSPAPQHILDQLAILAQEGGKLAHQIGSEVKEASPSLVKPEEPPVLKKEAETLSETSSSEKTVVSADDITDQEFESFLDELGKEKKEGVKEPVSKTSSSSEDITEDEFESFLNELSKEKKVEVKKDQKEPIKQDSPPVKKEESKPKSSDDITEDEFESLLDDLSKKKTTKVELPKSVPVTPSNLKEEIKKHTPEVIPIKPTADLEKSGMSALADKKVEKKQQEPVDTTVRVDTSRLDEIMNMVGELVLVRNRLVRLRGESSDENIAKAVGNLDVVTGDLQMAVMKTRMQPIKKVFGRFPRVVRDLARSLKKEIILDMEGEETDLDKNLVEALSDPLVHLVRNSVDHGIELPEERASAGKDKSGRILLSAQQAGDHILLAITDDGRGMDPEILRQKAVEKGIYDQEAASRLDIKDCFNLIFAPGFSTKAEISDISGRGVGMDVVKTKITQLNGTVEVNSKKGEGTTISIKVPLTLAILPTLMVIIGEQTFALPLSSVNEIFHLDLRKTNTVDGRLVVSVRDKAIPLFYLRYWLNKNGASHGSNGNKIKDGVSTGHVVVVTVGTQRIGFVVDGLLGQEEVVIKPLGDMLHGTPGMAGATITGDGKIAMILDIPSLLDHYANRQRAIA